ncbi:MAG: hypothetical protein L6R48_01235 [Planctomycetes bacterium]|nr:hypothetical protein [Planctomycetota bacterium]
MTRSRAGVALLIALAAVVVVLAAITTGVVAIGSATAHGAAADEDARLHALRDLGERLAQRWLAQHGQRLVLPPAGGGTVVCADRWVTAGGQAALVVTVFDGLAGIPPSCAGPTGALRDQVPGPLAAAISEDPPPLTGSTSDWLERLPVPGGWTRFPAVPASALPSWVTCREIGLPSLAGDGPPPLGVSDPPPALALVLAAHSDGRINLNTAPEALLRSAAHVIPGIAVAEVLAHRQQGQVSAAPSSAGGPLVWVATSDRWCIRVDAWVDGRARAWWVVMAGNPGACRIVQRHDCPPRADERAP